VLTPCTIRALAATPDVLFAGGTDGCVRQFSVESGLLLRRLPCHGGDVHMLALSPPRGLLFTAGYDGAVCAWAALPPARWTRETHSLWPPAFIAAVRTFLLCVARADCSAHAVCLGGATQAGLVDLVVCALAAEVNAERFLDLADLRAALPPADLS